jgi:hypothetical protein
LKLTSQLLLVLNLVLAVVLMLHISSVGGNEIRKGLIADREEATVSAHLNHLTSANHALLAQQAERQRVLADGRAEIRVKAAEHAQLLRWKESVDASTSDIQTRMAAAEAAKRDVEGIPGTYAAVADGISVALKNRGDRADAIRRQAGEELASLARARGSLAQISERYLRLEYNLGLWSRDLRRQSEQLYVYRFLRPDLQAEVGDNGRPNLSGTISKATGNMVELSIGSRDGVEMYQKMSVIRGGAVVAELNVIEVRSGTAMAEVRSAPLADRGVMPRAGDAVVARQLMLTGTGAGVAER